MLCFTGFLTNSTNGIDALPVPARDGFTFSLNTLQLLCPYSAQLQTEFMEGYERLGGHNFAQDQAQALAEADFEFEDILDDADAVEAEILMQDPPPVPAQQMPLQEEFHEPESDPDQLAWV